MLDSNEYSFVAAVWLSAIIVLISDVFFEWDTVAIRKILYRRDNKEQRKLWKLRSGWKYMLNSRYRTSNIILQSLHDRWIVNRQTRNRRLSVITLEKLNDARRRNTNNKIEGGRQPCWRVLCRATPAGAYGAKVLLEASGRRVLTARRWGLQLSMCCGRLTPSCWVQRPRFDRCFAGSSRWSLSFRGFCSRPNSNICSSYSNWYRRWRLNKRTKRARFVLAVVVLLHRRNCTFEHLAKRVSK